MAGAPLVAMAARGLEEVGRSGDVGGAARAVTAATVGRLMAAARLVARAVRAVTAARRPEEMASSEDLAAMVATAASWSSTSRSAALAAMPVLPERAALAATLLADRAA